MKQLPVLILGDHPSLRTGLGRVTRDLASHMASMPQLRVGCLGRGGLGSRQLPFSCYGFPESEQWGENAIEHAWEDFAGPEKGVIFTIWDASRLDWFAAPRPEIGDSLYRFLTSGRFKRWGYFPVDGMGVGHRLTALSSVALQGFDQVLGYGAWGAEILSNTLGKPVDWVPHGYNAGVFYPRGKTAGRMATAIPEGATVVGVNMTNQARKDWGLAFEVMAGIKEKIPDVVFLVHVDLVQRHWSIPALMVDFQLEHNTRVTFAGQFNDEQMAHWYSACDVTFLPAPEGFGYPLVESMACGVPVVHGLSGGGVELIPRSSWLVPPIATRLDTLHNIYRPVWAPGPWVQAIMDVLESTDDDERTCADAVSHLRWDALWPSAWRKKIEEWIG